VDRMQRESRHPCRSVRPIHADPITRRARTKIEQELDRSRPSPSVNERAASSQPTPAWVHNVGTILKRL
jgi:hypothetical protein